ncbi:MAG: HD domain-containing phosphohydrolase [Thermoanaerobaculia bacterium]
MHEQIDELKSKLKEILYDCAVDIKATKAALYLYDASDRYELVTEYGFRTAARRAVDPNDPLVEKCSRVRSAFYVNGLTAEPKLSEILFEASTDRLLVAPLFSRGQLVGLIDMRDKPAQQPFENSDLSKAQRIADRMLGLFVNKNLWNQRFITLSEDVHPQQIAAKAAKDTRPEPPPVPLRPVAAAKPVEDDTLRGRTSRLSAVVLEARRRTFGAMSTAAAETITEAEVAVARDVLRAILLLPDALVAALSAYGHLGGVQEIAARSTISDEAAKLLESKLNVWLTKRGEPTGVVKPNIKTPYGTASPPIGAAQLQKVFTAPVVVQSVKSLYLTVAFSSVPDRGTHEILAALLSQLQTAMEHSLQRTELRAMREHIAEKLLEPDFKEFPGLRGHSKQVVELVDRFTRFLGMPQAEVEPILLVALVHDVGMRMLDYDRLYTKRNLSEEEFSILKEHVSIGAALVKPLLGDEVSRAVLSHHERVDGRGYPNELQGEDIPYSSRVLQICDAYVAMTNPVYQDPQPREEVLQTISRAAGTQFDPDLTKRFLEMMRAQQQTSSP